MLLGLFLFYKNNLLSRSFKKLFMPNHQFVLTDHHKEWTSLQPLTLTKPIAHLRIGILKIYEKWAYYLSQTPKIKTVAAYLNAYNSFDSEINTTFIHSSVLPTTHLAQAILNLNSGESLYAQGTLVASKIGNTKETFEKEVAYMLPITKLSNPWDFFACNEQEIALDFAIITHNKTSQAISQTNTIIGETKNIFLEPGATVEASILNASNGYIYIGENAEIMEGSMVRGSLALCESASLKLGAKIYGATTIGPHSKVGGEVNNAVIQGYTNKGHDGFLGNSVLGEWCNLGADTNNSNLKNNYGSVRAYSFSQKDYVDTHLQFLGLIMGDHTKCSINTMFNTGTVTGVFANIFGSDFPPKFIPSFSWGGSQGFVPYDIEKALDVARAVMQRRHIELTKNEEDILRYLYKNTQV